jgi:hypothetical protein
VLKLVTACALIELLSGPCQVAPVDAGGSAAGATPVALQNRQDAAVTTQASAPDEPKPLNPQGTVLLDTKNKRLLLKTRIALREGLLEMFLCKAQTKEHESILAVDSDAFVIHAGLLALGAKPGTPVKHNPEFKPPTGQKIDVYVGWKDEEGKEHRDPAQSWVRHVTRRYYDHPLGDLPAGFELPRDSELRYDPKRKELIWFGPMTAAERDKLLALSQDAGYRKAIRAFFDQSQSRQMEADWVFAGSGFFTQKDGKKWYQAEGGNLICVANFSDAMLDVTTPSSAENAELLFEPYTERIPEYGTEVTLELIPVFEKTADQADTASK